MLINMIREPQGSANIFSNNGQKACLDRFRHGKIRRRPEMIR